MPSKSPTKSAPKASTSKAGSQYYAMIIKLLKDDSALKRGATKQALHNRMKEEMPEASQNQKVFLNAIKKNLAKGVGQNEILVYTKEKGILSVTAETLTWNGSQRFRLAPEARVHYGKLEKLAAKKAEGVPVKPKKKVVAAVSKKSTAKKTAGSKKDSKKNKGTKVAKKVVSRSNTSVLKKAKRAKVSASKKVKKTAAK